MTAQARIYKQEDDDRVYKLHDGRLAKKLAELANGDLVMQVIPDEPDVEKSMPAPEPTPPTHEQLAHLTSTFESTFAKSRTPASATAQLDAMTLEYAKANNVDRPTARVAVCKSAEGKRLYAESIGRTDAPERGLRDVPKSASDCQRELDQLVAKHCAAHGCDRPTATVAVLKTAEGKQLYAASISRSRSEQVVAKREATSRNMTAAIEKQRELEQYAKSKGLRLADAVMTPEGRRLYNESVRASHMGGV